MVRFPLSMQMTKHKGSAVYSSSEIVNTHSIRWTRGFAMVVVNSAPNPQILYIPRPVFRA